VEAHLRSRRFGTCSPSSSRSRSTSSCLGSATPTPSDAMMARRARARYPVARERKTRTSKIQSRRGRTPKGKVIRDRRAKRKRHRFRRSRKLRRNEASGGSRYVDLATPQSVSEIIKTRAAVDAVLAASHHRFRWIIGNSAGRACRLQARRVSTADSIQSRSWSARCPRSAWASSWCM